MVLIIRKGRIKMKKYKYEIIGSIGSIVLFGLMIALLPGESIKRGHMIISCFSSLPLMFALVIKPEKGDDKNE
jgi:hypothetical protein